MLDEHYAKLLSELPNGQDEILSMIIVEASRHSQEVRSRLRLTCAILTYSVEQGYRRCPQDCNYHAANPEKLQPDWS